MVTKRNKKGEIISIIALAVILVSAAVVLFVVKEKITGFAVYSGQDACGSVVTEDSTLSGDVGPCDDAIGQGYDGLIVNTSSVTLDCLGHAIIGEGGEGIGINVSASDVAVKNCNITEFEHDLYVENINLLVVDSFLSSEAAGMYVVTITSGNNATFVNVSHDASKENVESGASLEVKWYLDVVVKDASGNAVEGATVYAFNDSEHTYSGTTDSNGRVRFNVTDYVNEGGTKTYYNFYTVNASKAGIGEAETTVTANDNKEVTLTLGTIDNAPEVNLVSPANNTISKNVSQIFTCNATDDMQLANITLHVWNSTGLYYTNTKQVSGTFNSSSWQLVMQDENYTWNCLAYDNASQEAWADSNWSIVVDTVAPVFTDLANLSIYTNESLYYDVNASDERSGVIQVPDNLGPFLPQLLQGLSI